MYSCKAWAGTVNKAAAMIAIQVAREHLDVKLRGSVDQRFCCKPRSTIQDIQHVLSMPLEVLALDKDADAAQQGHFQAL